MPRADFVEVLFDRLTLHYGHAFLARWKGVPLEAVKAHWARELIRYADQSEAIEHALALLDPAKPPTAAQFRDLCSTAPGPVFRAEPEPKQAHRAAEVRRKCLRPVMPRIGRDVTWAAEMVKRAQAGERVPMYSLRLALDALGHPRCVVYPLEEIAAEHERVEAGAGAKVLVRLQAAASPQS